MADDDGDSWTCPACTLKNELMVEACEACGATSPLVLESYEVEAQGWAEAEGAPRSRVASQDSDNSTPRSEDMSADLNPWTQAECEWAHVEARQDARPRK